MLRNYVTLIAAYVFDTHNYYEKIVNHMSGNKNYEKNSFKVNRTIITNQYNNKEEEKEFIE